LRRTSKLLIIAVLAAAVVSGTLLTLYVTRLPVGASTDGNGTSYPPYTDLPAGCVKPAGGFLVIANQNGFNDSIQHGAPTEHWPMITVKQGTTVNITVCNSDVQAHGFQITHYFDSNIETVEPGQVVRVSFVADRPGDFEIYCSIFCSIHIFMQNGLLQVTS
jgi:FtsP/CotA-like multicopper oxidase with cupredoxin domain